MRRVPTTEEKPEVPISRDVKGIWELDSGPAFEGFFERLERLECLKTGSSRPRDRLKSVYLVMSVFFFVSAFLSRSDAIIKAISRKTPPKRGVFERMRTSECPDLRSLPNSGFLGRWHSPQIATAAPPAPRVHSSLFFVPSENFPARFARPKIVSKI